MDILKLYQQNQPENLWVSSKEGKDTAPSFGPHWEKHPWHWSGSDEGLSPTCPLTTQYLYQRIHKSPWSSLTLRFWLSAHCCCCLLKWPSVCPAQPPGPAGHNPFTHLDLVPVLAASHSWNSFLTQAWLPKTSQGLSKQDPQLSYSPYLIFYLSV